MLWKIYIHFSTRYIVIVESFSLLSDRKRLNATNERTVCVVSCHGMGSALSAAASRARKIVVTFPSVNNRHFHQFVSDRGWLTLTQPMTVLADDDIQLYFSDHFCDNRARPRKKSKIIGELLCNNCELLTLLPMCARELKFAQKIYKNISRLTTPK